MGRLESPHQMPAQVAWFDSDTIFTTAIDARDLSDTSKSERSLSKLRRRYFPHFSASLFGLSSMVTRQETARFLSYLLHNQLPTYEPDFDEDQIHSFTVIADEAPTAKRSHLSNLGFNRYISSPRFGIVSMRKDGAHLPRNARCMHNTPLTRLYQSKPYAKGIVPRTCMRKRLENLIFISASLPDPALARPVCARRHVTSTVTCDPAEIFPTCSTNGASWRSHPI